MAESISEAEAAVYDRQIRLWGLDAQKRLSSLRVLVAGLCGLGSEICKNLVLAGIKSLVLLDHCEVTSKDSTCQFLVDVGDVGKNRAECSREFLKKLNPMVNIEIDKNMIYDRDTEYFLNFDVVCIIGYELKFTQSVNEICHKNNIKFFCGEVYGFYGYFFSDLQSHSYTEETKIPATDGSKEQEVKITKKKLEFSSLPSLNDLDEPLPPKTCDLFYIYKVLTDFRESFHRSPSVAHREEDLLNLSEKKDAVLSRLKVSKDRLDDSFLSQVFGQLSPVCAIVGGVLAQEIIKAVSCKDKPLKNFFFFNGITNKGTVEHIEAKCANK